MSKATTKHTPTPWKTDGWDLWHFGAGYSDHTDPHLFTGITTHKGCMTPEATANLGRIVQCVNACEGIEDPAQTLALVREALRVAMLGKTSGNTHDNWAIIRAACDALGA